MSVSLPIPEPRAEDDEDVHWALSTASALWARGEPQEALKWLRRAAETASDANRDARSLELFKAAADFANGIQAAPKPSTPPVAPPQQAAPLAPPAGWPSPGVVQMTVGNQLAQPQPRPQSSAPPPPHRSQPPPIPSAANGGPPQQRTGPPPAVPAQGRGPVHPPPQRQGSSPNVAAPPARGPSRGEPQTWQPRAGQAPPPGPFHPSASGGVAMPHSEVMAPTVPHPTAAISQIPWQTPTDPSTARIPITDVDAAIKKMEAQRLASSAVKTLASNTSFEDLAEESVRKSAKSTKSTARGVTSERATNPGVGPQGGVSENGTVVSPQAIITSAVAAPASPSSEAAAARAGTSEPAQAKPAKRRATQSGRRAKADPMEQVTRVAPAPPTVPGVPSGEVAIHEAGHQDEARTMRFDDEGTLEQHATLVGVLAYDLDEQTNVLTGTEANLVLKPEHQNGVESVAKDSATEADDGGPTSDTPTDSPELPAGASQVDPPRERPLTDRPPSADVGFRSLSAYRVALYRTASGALEVKMLAPGEPTPAGRVGAILVPVDAVSSTALYELLAAKPR